MMRKRFRGFLPVVIDVETGGFDPQKDALLEIAAVFLNFDEQGQLKREESLQYHVQPFPKSNIDPASLKITGIDPYHPLRPAWPEEKVIEKLGEALHAALKKHQCQKVILVGHNAAFDLSFVQALWQRHHHPNNPFHSFSTLDTVSLGAVFYGANGIKKDC